MNVLVCGGRNYQDKVKVFKVLNKIAFKRGISKIVNGGAYGADRLSSLWAKSRDIDLAEYAADWNKHGRSAGPIRNSEMLSKESIDLVVAFPGGRGTADMVNKARAAGINVVEIT